MIEQNDFRVTALSQLLEDGSSVLVRNDEWFMERVDAS